jgi:hypothetical protein
MPNDNRSDQTQPSECLLKYPGVSARCPDAAASPRTVSVPGTVEEHDAIGARQSVDDAAGKEILDHRSIAMQ